jgi:rubrerythrin
MREFSELSEREVLALAIGSEEEDGRIYNDIAERMRDDYPATAKVFIEMAAEESEHRHKLLDLYREKFGEHIPLIRRQDVRGFITRRAVWQLPKPRIDDVRRLAESMEAETQRFYRLAASRATDISIRKLLGDLAEAEQAHEHRADELSETNLTETARSSEDATAERRFMLQYVQPGTARSRRWRRFSRRHFPRIGHGMPFSWGWRRPSGLGFRWDLPRHCPMTGVSPGGGRRYIGA